MATLFQSLLHVHGSKHSLRDLLKEKNIEAYQHGLPGNSSTHSQDKTGCFVNIQQF